MLKNNEEKILNLIKLSPLSIVLISIIVLYTIFINNNKILEQQIKQIEEQSIIEKKSIIKREVEIIYNYIENELQQTKLNIKQNTKNRVNEAISIIKSIYRNNPNKDENEIKKLIIDVLRDIRFNGKRGYFFINDIKGKSIMHPISPELENKSLWNIQDKSGIFPVRESIKVLLKKKEGFLTYWWNKPDKKEENFEKISFVKLFKPFNWVVGTGEYIVDYENILKEQLLKKIQNIRFGKNGYIFVYKDDGTTLSHVKKELIGKNRINLQDESGKFLVKEIIEVGKKGEDYISYVGTVKPSTGKPAEKISFIKGFNKWNWSIGAGVYTGEIDAQIEQKNNLILKNNNSQFKKILLLNLFIFTFLFITSLYLSRVTRNKFLAYNKARKEKTEELEKLNNTLESKVEERTKEQNSLLSLFDKGDSVLFRWNNDENWSVDFVSSTVSNLIGYTKEDFVEGVVSYADCIHPDDLQQTIKEDAYRKKENKEFFRHAPYRIITKDGTVKWILEYNLMVKNKNDEVTHFLGYILDETSNQKSREDLEIAKRQALDASHAKSEFLANMSHEIRTPMNGIIGMTTLALSKIDTDVEQAKEFIKKGKNSAKMLLGIINDILDFSKIEARKIEIENKQVSLGEILSQMNDLFTYIASQKDIKFTIEYDNMVPEYILGDKLRLTQVLTNLISNAVKFTQKGSIKLKIELLSKEKENIQLKFLVSDTGKGIAKENQHKLFKSFSQEDSSISREYGGTGLGLTISKNLVELMNGKIGFESFKNEGTTFFFTLNTKLVEEQNIRTKEKKVLKNENNEILDARILLVEDNNLNQELAYNFLSQIIKEIDIANNGQEAVDMLDSKEADYYNLVLMDIHMPILDGNNATIKIKEGKRYKDLPIIAMTANVLKKELEYSVKCGMSDYIIKPFEVQELFDKVVYWINKKRKVKTVSLKEKKESNNKTLDTNSAIDRMLGQKDLYKNFLESYLSNKIDTFNKIEKLIEKNRLNEAISELHSLRGVLSTMGAIKLSEILLKIEDNLKTKGKTSNVLIKNAKCEIKLVIQEINKWLNEN